MPEAAVTDPPSLSPAESAPSLRPGVTLAAVVALGFAVRLGSCLLKAVVSTDAYWYVRIAKMMRAGDWGRALENGYHPGFPALTALTSLFVRDIPLAAYVVTITLGALTAIPAWFIGKRLGGPRVAFFAALLVALHPEAVDEGSDILVEATYLFFFLCSIACTLRAVAGADLRAAAGAGLAAGLAYLTRPEGMVLPAFAIAAILAAGVPALRAVPVPEWGRRSAAAAVLAAAFLLAFLPYAAWMHAHFGRWMITPKAGGEAFQGGPQAARGEPQKDVEAKSEKSALYLPWFFTRKFAQTIYLGFLPLLAAALLLRRPASADARLARLALLFLLAIYLPPLARLLYAKGYLSTRHLLAPAVLVVLLLAPAAAALSEKWKRGLAVTVLLLAAVALPKSLRPSRTNMLPLKDAGLWLREHAKGREFMGPEKPAFYADVEFHHLPKSGASDEIATEMKGSRVEWLVLLEDEAPGVAAKLDGRFQPEAGFGKDEDRVTIYRLAE